MGFGIPIVDGLFYFFIGLLIGSAIGLLLAAIYDIRRLKN